MMVHHVLPQVSLVTELEEKVHVRPGLEQGVPDDTGARHIDEAKVGLQVAQDLHLAEQGGSLRRHRDVFRRLDRHPGPLAASAGQGRPLRQAGLALEHEPVVAVAKLGVVKLEVFPERW